MSKSDYIQIISQIPFEDIQKKTTSLNSSNYFYPFHLTFQFCDCDELKYKHFGK